MIKIINAIVIPIWFILFIWIFTSTQVLASNSVQDTSIGDKVAGEKRYNVNCKNCHGPAGKGAASYPKISGKEMSYIKDRLETYRSGKEIGPNSALMIMMAKSLTDEEINNLAAYLKDAKYMVK